MQRNAHAADDNRSAGSDQPPAISYCRLSAPIAQGTAEMSRLVSILGDETGRDDFASLETVIEELGEHDSIGDDAGPADP